MLGPIVRAFSGKIKCVRGFANSGSNLDKYYRFLSLGNDAKNRHQVRDLYTLGERIEDSLQIIANSIERFGFGNVFLSFNGGKDSVVTLHLYRIAAQYILKQSNVLQCVYFKDPKRKEFPQVTQFIDTIKHKYQLQLKTIESNWSDGIKFLGENSAFIMGSRSADCEGFEPIMPSKIDSFNFTRVNPILRWNYGHVWDFILHFNLDYCPLYNQGFTSIGCMEDSVPNPSLKRGDSYLPAYKLDNWQLERLGRLKS